MNRKMFVTFLLFATIMAITACVPPKKSPAAPFSTRTTSTAEGVIVAEPWNVIDGTLLVARVVVDGGGIVPVIFNPDHQDAYRVIAEQGKKVKVSCHSYGYSSNFVGQVCTFQR